MQTSLCALLVIAFAGATMAFAPSTLVLGLRNSAPLCSASKGFRSGRVAPKMSMGGLTEVANQALLVAGEGMAVSVAAYLAVLLGTFVPVVFLITLFIQSEARKATTEEN